MVNQGSRGMVDRLLAESFKELACRQPVEKITIKAITDRAGVIRPTFYNHFQDKYELLEWIIKKDIIEPTHPLFQNGMTEQAMQLMLAAMERDKEFYCMVVKTGGQNSFASIAQKCIRELLEQLFDARLKAGAKKAKSKWWTKEHLAAYYAQSLCYLVENWLQSGMLLPAKEMTDVYMYIMTHSIDDVLEDLPETVEKR